MLRRLVIAAFVSLLLAACGRGSEDFATTIGRPADKVEAAFDNISADSEIAALVTGLKIARTNPAPGEVLYTIPGDGSFPATVKLTFEGSADGQSTVVHGAVDVPSTKVNFDGKPMVIDEGKVEKVIRGLVREAGKKLEKGEVIDTERRDLSRMLTVLAIITDSKKLRLATEISQYPEWYMDGLGWLSGIGGGSANPYSDADFPDDPAAAARQDEYKQSASEREERNKAEENSEPMESARGDSAPGDYAGGSDE
jgi:hypothetical protein